MEKIDDLRPGMVLEGVVTNVAAFGAFVDVGVHQDGLVHVSAMSRTFVTDPREVVKSGDVVKVKVLEVDVARKRIALTLRLDDDPDGTPAACSRPPGTRPAGSAARPRPASRPSGEHPAADGTGSDAHAPSRRPAAASPPPPAADSDGSRALSCGVARRS